jgi:hypothetical protein
MYITGPKCECMKIIVVLGTGLGTVWENDTILKQSKFCVKVATGAGHQWHRPIILATQEAESRRIQVRSQPRQTVCETLSQKKKNPSQKKGAGGIVQGEGPEFKLQYHQKKKKKEKKKWLLGTQQLIHLFYGNFRKEEWLQHHKGQENWRQDSRAPDTQYGQYIFKCSLCYRSSRSECPAATHGMWECNTQGLRLDAHTKDWRLSNSSWVPTSWLGHIWLSFKKVISPLWWGFALCFCVLTWLLKTKLLKPHSN